MTDNTNAAPMSDNTGAADVSVSADTETSHVGENSNTVAMTADEQAAFVGKDENGEYQYVPEKFLKDGKPDWEALTKSYKHLEQQFSKGLHKPADAPDEYNYDFGEGREINPEAMSAFKQAAMENGLSPKQFEFVMGQYDAAFNEIVEQYKPSIDKASKVLTEAWGDSFDVNVENAVRAFDAFAPEGLDRDKIGNIPEVMMLLASIGAQMGEDKAPSSSSAQSSLTEMEIADLRARPDRYTNKEVARKISEYYASKYRG